MPPHDRINEKLLNDQNELINNEASKTEIASILDNSLTDEEKRIINEVPNSEIRDIIMQIINELCKRICKGENPSQKFFDDTCYQVLSKNNIKGGGVYFGYTKSIIRKLPDWKGFANLFDYDNQNSLYISLIEFRKKRGGIDKTKSRQKSIIYPQEITSKPRLPTAQLQTIEKKQEVTTIPEKPIEKKTKQQKFKAQYKKINEKGYAENFQNFEIIEGESIVPLLSPEDIAFSVYNGAYECITKDKDTKVPSFHAKVYLEKYFKDSKNSKLTPTLETILTGKPYSFYDKINDVSHVILFCNGRGLDAGLHITIKGKISQNDAADLIKHLKEKYNYKIDFSTGYPVSKDEFIPLKRSNIQETIADFFNNK